VSWAVPRRARQQAQPGPALPSPCSTQAGTLQWPSSGILHVCMCMYFWAHTDNILIDLSCMYEQKDTYTYRHHTDMSVLDTYMYYIQTNQNVHVFA
jgi:hypothetical protein